MRMTTTVSPSPTRFFLVTPLLWKRCGVLLVIVGLWASLAVAEEPTEPFVPDLIRRIDEVFAPWDRYDSPGYAVGVVQDGKLVFVRGYGMANLEHDVPITGKTVFRLGSLSKQFTAACLAILDHEGQLALTDDIRKYLPELRRLNPPVTLRHLIHHTAGFESYTKWEVGPGTDNYTPEDSFNLIVRGLNESRGRLLCSPPGSRYCYSDSSYFLMSLIIQRASGKTLRKLAEAKLFAPAGMKQTRFQDDYRRIVVNRADGYSRIDNELVVDMTTLDHVGDGGAYSSIEDLYLWDQALTNEMLGPELTSLLLTPAGGGADGTGAAPRTVCDPQKCYDRNGRLASYAFGLGVSSYRGLATIEHAGGWVGFRSRMVRFPGQQVTILLLSNFGQGGGNFYELSDRLADIVLEGRFPGSSTSP